jgi:hypothetical protein
MKETEETIAKLESEKPPVFNNGNIVIERHHYGLDVKIELTQKEISSYLEHCGALDKIFCALYLIRSIGETDAKLLDEITNKTLSIHLRKAVDELIAKIG